MRPNESLLLPTAINSLVLRTFCIILQTNGMYHEYTGVSRAYRGKKIALALKIKAVRLAKHGGASYLRTDNDSLNEPILKINRQLGYAPLRGSYRIIAPLDQVLAKLHVKAPR